MRTSRLVENHSETPTRPYHRFLRISSQITSERCCLLILHLIFTTVILSLIYVRLKQFGDKQDKLFIELHRNRSSTELEHREQNFSVQPVHRCSCEKAIYPKRNRTSDCLQIRVGFTDMIDNVFCSTPDEDQWLKIQNRESNRVHFNRSWIEYRRGFGDVHRAVDFWIGNDNLFWLTNKYPCRLKIQLTDWFNETRTAIYEQFLIGNHKDEFRIHISDYRGNIEIFKKIDSFSRWHNNVPFSTYDHFATDQINCPEIHGGAGWWYHFGKECAHVQLNGQLPTHSDGLVPHNYGILWVSWKNDRHHSFQRVEMAIQRKSSN